MEQELTVRAVGCSFGEVTVIPRKKAQRNEKKRILFFDLTVTVTMMQV